LYPQSIPIHSEDTFEPLIVMYRVDQLIQTVPEVGLLEYLSTRGGGSQVERLRGTAGSEIYFFLSSPTVRSRRRRTNSW
jgi:hypothetical protein